MKLYEINSVIFRLTDQIEFDEETGEILFDIDSLQMERHSILSWLAKLILNLRSEEAGLKKRRERITRKQERLMHILDRNIAKRYEKLTRKALAELVEPAPGHGTPLDRFRSLMAEENITDADIWQALGEADIAELIRELGGLEAKIGDRGTTLSGGERQRIGIARAFLRNPDMLILDEPLANIDPFLEISIAKNIRRARAERTTVVIAHRLASILIADYIIMLDDGKIVAQGTQQELRNNPAYRRLLGQQIA